MSKQEVDAQAAVESKRLFDNYDSDNNGYLDKQEFERMLTDLFVALQLPAPSEQTLESARKFVDTDGNGRIDYAEFQKWWVDFSTEYFKDQQ